MGRKVEMLFEWAIAAIPVCLVLGLAYWLLVMLLNGLRDA
jgi:hypothetical protein